MITNALISSFAITSVADSALSRPRKTVNFASIKHRCEHLKFATGSFQKVYLAGTKSNTRGRAATAPETKKLEFEPFPDPHVAAGRGVNDEYQARSPAFSSRRGFDRRRAN